MAARGNRAAAASSTRSTNATSPPSCSDRRIMTLPRITAFSILWSLPSALLAQPPAIEVQDLLLPQALASQPLHDAIVTRAFHDIEYEYGKRPWHGVEGEGHLLGWKPFDELPRFQGIYTEESLTAVLAALRGAGRSGVRFDRIGEVVVVDTEYPEQIVAALQQVRQVLPPRIRVQVALERISEAGSSTLLSGTATFRNGRVQVIGDVERRRILRDLEVEIAQAAATASPKFGEVRHGSSIALRARPMPFRDEAVLELVVRTATPMPSEPIRAHPALGPLDRVASRIDEAGLAFRLGRGAETRHEWTAVDGSRLRLTCRADWKPTPPLRAESETQVVCSSLFGPPVLGFRSASDFSWDEPRWATSVAAIVARTRSVAGEEAAPLFEPGAGAGEAGGDDDGGGQSGGGVLLLTGTAGQRYQRALAERLGQALRPVSVVVEILDVPSGVEVAAATSDGALADGVRIVGRLSGPLLVALPVCFASAREQSYVRDWEVEVAQSARIPDPKVEIVEDGWFASLQAATGPKGTVAAVDLDLRIDMPVELRKLSASLNWAMTALASVTDDTRPPTMWLPQDVLAMEMPVERAMSVDARLDLDAQGQAMLRRSATSLFGPGRELVVRLSVQHR